MGAQPLWRVSQPATGWGSRCSIGSSPGARGAYFCRCKRSAKLFTFIYAGRQLSLLSSQEAVEKRLHTLAAIRKTAHIGDAEEQISSSLRMARLQANIIELQQVREQSSRALALLTNKTLTQTVQLLHDKINLTPDIRIKEIPADLLRTRPDIDKQKLMYCNLPLMWGWLKLRFILV